MLANDLNRYEQDIIEFRTAYHSLIEQNDAFQQAIERLNDMWSGEAHDSFNRRFEEDKRVVQEMLNYFQTVQEAMEFAGQEYQACEASVHEAVAGL